MTSSPVLPLPCRKPNRRVRVSLRVEHWPAPDRQAWHAPFTTGDLFDEQGPGTHLASRTRTSLENVYGRWLGFLASTEPNAFDEPLAARVIRERIVSLAQHLAETNIPSSVAGQLRHLRGALRVLAAGQDWGWLLTIVKMIEAMVKDLPGLHLVGNAYYGIGVPDCIKMGKAAAERIAGPAG